MRRFILLAAAFLALGASPAIAGEFTEVEVNDLVNDPATYQGPVVVVGELIGDFGFRRDGSMWTQLNDDSYTFEPVLDDGPLTGSNVGIAVRIPTAIAEELDPPGGYRVRGPVVEVTGIWRYHDPDRSGESYLDVVELAVAEPGRGLSEHPNYLVGVAGLVLIGFALVSRLRRI